MNKAAKTKKAASTKKSAAKAKPAAGKKAVAKTKKAKGAAPKKAAVIKKQIARKKPAARPQKEAFLPPGEDLYLVPVKGEIHPARINEKNKVEHNFHHNEEVALHQEQMRVKSMMSNRSRKIFNRPRFS